MGFTMVEQTPGKLIASCQGSTKCLRRRSGALLLSLAIGAVVVFYIRMSNDTQRSDSVWVLEKKESRDAVDGSILEFVHIPKTGGSSLARVAAVHGIGWSLCHYSTKVSKNVTCPPSEMILDMRLHRLEHENRSEWWPPFWHIPPRYLSRWTPDEMSDNPYLPPKRLFCVVRHPYDRLLSEWYFHCTKRSPSDRPHANNATRFNQFVSQKLHHFQRGIVPRTRNDMSMIHNPYWIADGHMIPQHHYVFEQEKKVIPFVLRFENLATEFAMLMKAHGYPLQLPLEKENESRNKRLSIENLTRDNLELVHEVYERDFVEFGYDKIQLPT